VTARQPTNADLWRVRHCARYGHGWPPLRRANPGDTHWCHYCGSRREITPDGAVIITREWDD
jgi:hypothetical protein